MDPISGDISDLSILSNLDDTQLETARILREVLDHYLSSENSSGNTAKKTVLERIAREQALQY